jgi:hypothetical protein
MISKTKEIFQDSKIILKRFFEIIPKRFFEIIPKRFFEIILKRFFKVTKKTFNMVFILMCFLYSFKIVSKKIFNIYDIKEDFQDD